MDNRVLLKIETRVRLTSKAGEVLESFSNEKRTTVLSALQLYYPLAIARKGRSLSEVESAIAEVQSLFNRLADEARSIAPVEQSESSIPMSHAIPPNTQPEKPTVNPNSWNGKDEF